MLQPAGARRDPREPGRQIRRQNARAGLSVELTSREKEVLQLICEQKTNPEIGATLFISSRTVEGHRNNLLSKLGCRNTAGLVVYVLQHQLVQLDGTQHQW
ncbi:MAG: response regulator transcription factor [Saprospiraceae bacterium]|nr:response regulator transcription factor [Saprospiraceae bacterium]